MIDNMKRYNEFINESIRDKMVGKTKEEITKNKSVHDLFTSFSYGDIPKDYLPTKEETRERISLNDLLYWIKDGLIPTEYKPTTEEIRNDKDYKKLDAIEKKYLVQNFDLDESLLPTDNELDQAIEIDYIKRHNITIKETEKIINDLKKLGVDAKLEVIKDVILKSTNRYMLDSPIRIYYYKINNGNHVILKTLTLKGSEKIIDSIKKNAIDLSDLTISEPDGHFDSTTISVKRAKDIINNLDNEKV